MIISHKKQACLILILLLSTFLFTMGASADTGDAPLIFISGSIVFDRDASESVTSADEGLENVSVSLLSENGAVLHSQDTDVNGSYLFSGLDLGTYSVVVNTETLPTGVSRFASLNPETPVTLEDGNTSVANYDFGYASTLSIGDLVFLDIRETIPGVQDVGDVPLAGVIVELYSIDLSNQLVGSVETNDAGKYQFTNLEPGNYFIRFIVPDSLRDALLAEGLISENDVLAFVDANSGDDTALDSDVSRFSQDENGSNIGETSTISLVSGDANDFSFDAGVATDSASVPLAVQTNEITAVTHTMTLFFMLFGLLATVSVVTRKV